MRTEFGASRSTCACGVCKNNCRVIPGYLIPADLDRMIPQGTDPFKWAEENLLVSPGALVANSRNMVPFRIPTLVPAIKPEGGCINLTRDGMCGIHEVAPFGCAFFSCTDTHNEANKLSAEGLKAICQDENGLYFQIWQHLERLGLKSANPEKKRESFKNIKVGLLKSKRRTI